MNSFLRGCARKIPAVQRLLAERNAIAAELVSVSAARDQLSAEKQALEDQLALLTSERDALAAERDSLAAERDALTAERDGLAKRPRKALLDTEDYVRDLLRLQLEPLDKRNLVRLRIVTDHPIAAGSDDHKHPRGAANDNTRHPRFAAKCEEIFGRKISHLDLGCAGGGLVWDFVMAGHQSYGIEGSDLSLLDQRATWRILAGNLFTADVTRPFHFVTENGVRQKFDVISAWELLEHLPEEALPGFLDNLRANLAEDGLFVASVATFRDEDPATGAVWHVTVQPLSWWCELFQEFGFEKVGGLFAPGDYVRGSGNPRADDWDEAAHPDLGFHITLRIAQPREDGRP